VKPAGESQGLLIPVRVQPRSGRTELVGQRGDALLVRLAAPPVKGAANRALLKFLADLLDVPSTDLAIVRGAQSRDKVVRVATSTPDQLRRRLDSHLNVL